MENKHLEESLKNLDQVFEERKQYDNMSLDNILKLQISQAEEYISKLKSLLSEEN